MSGRHDEDGRGGAGQRGVVFFSNPLMSDVESDWSPVHDAAFNGRLVTLRNLIAQGVCVNLSTLDRVSPLYGACMRGHTACAKLLVENGANVDSPTVDGKTALGEACAGGHVTCVSLLLQHGAAPRGTGQSSSPIHLAAAAGQSECVEALVQHGADVDQLIQSVETPLHVACSNQHLGTVKKLLQLGANVNQLTPADSPLHMAARLSNPELVSVLLDHGADHHRTNSEGKRPSDLAPAGSPAAHLLKHAGGVPALTQLCRLYVRKAVGRQRLAAIPDLHLPKQIIHYLLHQSDSREDLKK